VGSPFDTTTPAGQQPFLPGNIQDPAAGSAAEAQLGFWDRLALFVRRRFFYVVPKPCEFWVVHAFTLAAGQDTWIDQRIAVQGRRAWSIVNLSIVAGQNVWINSHAMSAVGQGGCIFNNGGVASLPVGSGNAGQQVHAFPTAAGIVVSFFQLS